MDRATGSGAPRRRDPLEFVSTKVVINFDVRGMRQSSSPSSSDSDHSSEWAEMEDLRSGCYSSSGCSSLRVTRTGSSMLDVESDPPSDGDLHFRSTWQASAEPTSLTSRVKLTAKALRLHRMMMMYVHGVEDPDMLRCKTSEFEGS
mmetsp:Transcript_113499/g.321151  ORF Transcript_113499/g.321151 Transcript_113499/m.321151 type:complete len:146 (+) Transcript_113499:105-542(+)|eukprot:CAMPEP_0117553558 /NCGR_PEP_ID=MMETSP0784-20121206/50288_1 /TAXON_ID=39447 /ORGANISM="" /LENGTH=145 /DNA_ID=CAMNT_0005350671 /DNA_START=85 /DNA_END=522 /DNA_ORIENTATION=-